jgi:hypothetical protein
VIKLHQNLMAREHDNGEQRNTLELHKLTNVNSFETLVELSFRLVRLKMVSRFNMVGIGSSMERTFRIADSREQVRRSEEKVRERKPVKRMRE